MKSFNIEFFKYLKSFNFVSLINFFSFIKTIIINLFFKLESFLFGKKFGWNYNFFQIFNFIKSIFIFIWSQLTKLLPFLKVCEPLYDFFIIVVNIFIGNPVVDDKGIVIYTGFRANLISLFAKIPELFSTEHLMAPLGIVGIATIGATLPATVTAWQTIKNVSSNVGESAWTGIKKSMPEINALIEGLTSLGKKGYTAIQYSLKFIFQAISFTFKITIIIGKFLITFLLKILDIFIILLKIWFHIIKNIFVIIKIISILFSLFWYLYCDCTTDDKLINVIRKELFKSK